MSGADFGHKTTSDTSERLAASGGNGRSCEVPELRAGEADQPPWRFCCDCLHRFWHQCGLCRSADVVSGANSAAAGGRGAGPRHHRPASLSALSERTRFSRQELQLMYRGFKNDCPSGLVHRAAFREILSQFFPLGDASAYADLVFDSFDPGGRGCLTFETVIQGLSVICKGSTMEKLDWAFRLYDTDRDGFISKSEMVQLVSAIYALLGDSVLPRVNPCDAQLHAERIFEAMDADRDGVVNFQEFVLACRRGRDLDRELGCFDTLL